MTDNNSSYRSIFKATSLFGGVEIYQILILIAKSKIIAVFLGPLGVGILGLYHSAQLLIKQVTSLGLSRSAVRDVAEIYGKGNQDQINRIVAIVKKLVWYTGTIGLIVAFLLSPLLSRFTFGNYDYTIPFAFLSITLLLDQLSSGQLVILQGFRRLKDMAKASAYGATLGLLVSIPFYYYWGINGIVPTLILHSLATLLVTTIYARRVKVDRQSVTRKEMLHEGQNMLKLGIAMTISGVMTALVSYVVRWFIRVEGGLEEVGLYQAGFAIINVYVGMIFTAIGKDYYPRLSAVNQDDDMCREIVSKQGEIATLIMAPMLMVCLLIMPYLILLLYSNQFLPANDFVAWACLGMMFKLASWLISYIFVAKAESKLFVINEVSSCLYSLLFDILGYYWGGLTGLGVSFALSFWIYFVQVYVIANKRYSFNFSSDFTRVFSIELLFVTLILLIVTFMSNMVVLAIFLAILGIIYSLYGLEKKIKIISLIRYRK